MAFYQQIRKNSHIAIEAKMDARNAKIASDNALRSKWVDTNWTPLKEILEDEIASASDQGEFSVFVELRPDSFKDMCDSPLFKKDNVHQSIRWFIKLISKSCEADRNITWANKGFLDGFEIRHSVIVGVETVVFDISWKH
jgi:hypothetical protein